MGDKESVPRWLATDWEPLEISFVAVPFDDAAQARDNTDFSECEFIEKLEERAMGQGTEDSKQDVKPVEAVVEKREEVVETPAPAPEKKEEVAAAPAETPVPEVKKEDAPPPAESADARDLEGKRVQGILELTSRAKLSAEFAQSLIARKLSLEDAEKEIRTRWAHDGGNKMEIDNKVSVGEDQKRILFSEGMRNALLHRIDSSKTELSDKGQHFRGLSLIEMARELLAFHGISTRGMSRLQVAKLALSNQVQQRAGFQTTDDFPNILLDAANKTLRQSYEQAP